MNINGIGLVSIGIVIGIVIGIGGTTLVARWWQREAERQRAKLRDDSERAWHGLRGSLADMDAMMERQHEAFLAKWYPGDDDHSVEMRTAEQREHEERRAKRLEQHEQSLIRQRMAWPF